ncbi:Xylulose kinase [bacterium HR15]|nr:Xylulose kinase [bacterium HR15]
MYLVAIDLGTSVCKVAIFSVQGELVQLKAAPVSLSLLPDGGAEQDPREWQRVITQLVQQLLNMSPVPREQIRAVICSAQWSSTVAIDKAGEPIGNAIIWMDTRGAAHIRELIYGFPAFEGYSLRKLFTWIRLTGGAPGRAGKDPLAHILYLKHEQPDRYRAAWKFLEPIDYLNFWLSGTLSTSPEAITLHWLTDNRDLSRVDYHPMLLRWAGIEREKLPDIRRGGRVLGRLRPSIAEAWDLPRETLVIAGTPDIHAAAIGSGGVRDFDPHLYIGTSAWLSCHVPFKKTDLLHNMAALPAALPGRYFIANEQETAGMCLTFLRDHLFFAPDGLTGDAPPDAYARFDALAAEVPPGSEGLIFTPWLYGERTPVEDDAIRGGFHHLSLNHRRAHLVRAVLEGVALNLRWLLPYVERFAGRRFEQIRAIGGGARSDLWCQILADVLNRPIAQMENPVTATLRGAAMLGALELRQIHEGSPTNRFHLDPARWAPIRQVFQPDPANTRLYANLFRAFHALYRATRPIHAKVASNE